MSYSRVESAANAEAAENFYRKGLQCADSGDLEKAVRLLEKAARLLPDNTAYAAKHVVLARQLKAVHAEQERDRSDREADDGRNAWSNAPPRQGPEPSTAEQQDDVASDASGENADASGERENKRKGAFLRRKTLAEMWRSVRKSVASLFRARWATGLGEWAVSLLPRDEDRAYRLSYLGHKWFSRLELPLYLGGTALALRLSFAYPWALFSLACAAAVPLGWLVGRSFSVKRRTLGAALGAHVLFVWMCPYSAACLYCSVGWLAFASVFRLIALGVTGVLLWLYFLPWTTLYMALFAVWALFVYHEPAAILGITAVSLGLWYMPVHLVSATSLLFAAALAFDRSLVALPFAGLGVLTYLRPKAAASLIAAGALACAVYRRSALWKWCASVWAGDSEQEPARPRDGDAAVAHVMRASTHYEVLAVRQSATLGQVRSAYKRMALLLHPDKNTHPDAAAAFEKVMAANETLCSPRLRAQYDFAMWNSSKDEDSDEKEDEGADERARASHHRQPQQQQQQHGRHEQPANERPSGSARSGGEEARQSSNARSGSHSNARGERRSPPRFHSGRGQGGGQSYYSSADSGAQPHRRKGRKA